MLLADINIPTEIKYINPIAIMLVESIMMFFDTLDKNEEVLLLPRGCKIADVSFSIKLQITISKIGEIIVEMISKIPTRPTEFLIKTVLDKIKSMPSDKYPPITGT